MASAPLILSKTESGFLASVPRARPDTVFVLSYFDGSLRSFQGAPGRFDRTGSRWAYVVDQSQRFSTSELRIPARGDVYHFAVSFESAWHVTDAEAVVRSNIGDGEPVVAGFLRSAMWPLGRQFEGIDAQGAEEAIARVLRPPMEVGSGLTLDGVTVRLVIDPRLSDSSVADDEELRRQRLVQARVNHVRAIVPDLPPALAINYGTHPDDTGALVQWISEARQQDKHHQLALLDRFLAHGIVTEADGDQLRSMLLGGGVAAAPPALGSGQQQAPLALGPAPAHAPPPAPASGGAFGPALGSALPTTPPPLPSQASTSSRPYAPHHHGPQDQPLAAAAPPTRESPEHTASAPAPTASTSQDGVAEWKPLKRRPRP